MEHEPADSGPLTPLQKAFMVIKQLRDKLDRLGGAATEPIAVIGMGCRVPGAGDPESFWELVRDGRDAITTIPLQRWDAAAYYDPQPGRPGKTYARHGGFLDQVDRFDAAFFGISPREAESLDPQQRLLLEVTWEALEYAGLPPAPLAGSATGVFVGVTANDYGWLLMEQGDDGEVNPFFHTGNTLNACAGRIAYTLGLQGPCLAVDTACSASLTAIHLACTSLRARECDQALAGGVNLMLSPRPNVVLSAARMMAPDGRCKAFDAGADGYVRGEGCGVVVLKRYADALQAGDRILALIRGSAVNQDGASSGFTAPNGVAQQALMRRALAVAGVDAGEIDYVEAHGTGTALGDPIEAGALGAVLGQAASRKRPLLVGSVKSNIGHLESAAGVAGLIKLIQALRYEALPPTLHVKQPNPEISWEALHLRTVRELTPWPRGGKRRVAALSSFGASGSNAHLVLEEAPDGQPGIPERERSAHVLTLSAKSAPALKELACAYERFIAQQPRLSLGDMCFSANTGRNHFKQRVALSATDVEQARERLADFVADRPNPGVFVGAEPPAARLRPAFLFSGQGTVYADMGRELYETHAEFRQALTTCAEILQPLLPQPLLTVMYADERGANTLQQAMYLQPALFSLQYALVALWRSWVGEPAAVLGHSLGEYCAACIAGVFSLEDGLKLVLERARLMHTLTEHGSMAAVFIDEDRARQALSPYAGELAVAAINGPQHVVLSGRTSSLQQLLAQLAADGVESRPLQVTHAFHSPLMEPMLDAFEQWAQRIDFRAPQLPMISNLTGQPLPEGTVLDAAYWRRHCREPVRFWDGLAFLCERSTKLFVDIGPGATLANLGQRLQPSAVWLPSLRPRQPDWQVLSTSLAAAYAHGADIDWASFDAPFLRNRLTLPTYAFQRKRYWMVEREPSMNDQQAAVTERAQSGREEQREAIVTRLGRLVAELLHTSPADIDMHLPFLEMGADSLLLVEAVRLLEDQFGVKLAIRQFFEEITTLDSLADYLSERTAFGLAGPGVDMPTPSMPSAPAALPTPTVPPSAPTSPLTHTVAAAPAPAPTAQPTPSPALASGLPPLPPVEAGTGAVLERVALAQMQLMARQLEIIRGVPTSGVATSEMHPSGLMSDGDRQATSPTPQAPAAATAERLPPP